LKSIRRAASPTPDQAEGTSQGWAIVLASLKSLLETGRPAQLPAVAGARTKAPGLRWFGRLPCCVCRQDHLPLLVMSVSERLAAAVLERRVVRFRYLHSGATGERTCHPHVLYETAAGHLLLDAVQTEGPSESGADTPWRTFDPAFVIALSVPGQSFEPDPTLNLDCTKYHRIRAHC